MFLGLDLGTSNVKALIADASGRTLGQGSSPVRLFHVADGGVEQDLEEIWSATLSAIQQATRSISPAEIHAVGVSSQGGALQLLDPQREPIGRVISWLDQRARAENEALTAELGRDWFARRLGHGTSGLAIGQILRLRRESFLAQSSRIAFVGDSIVSRLCGHPAQDGTSASLTLLYNPVLRAYDPDLLRRLDLQPDQLPDLLSPHVPAGSLSSNAASQTGLPAGIPVSPAIHDQYSAALGTGAVQPGTTLLGVGTAWVLVAVSSTRARLVTDNAFSCHHLADHLEGQILSLVNGGSALSWVLDLAGMKDPDCAALDRLLDSIPPGSEGLACWPFLAPSSPQGLAAGLGGRLSGLQLSHRPAHFARAVLEGLGFELNRHLLLLQRAGIAVQELMLGGTTAGSRVTPQIIADITGLPLNCYGQNAGSPLGAAIVARGLREPQRSLPDLASEMLGPARRVEPGQNATFYSARFDEYLDSLPIQQETAA